jgi:hypothetical protein
MEVDSTPSVSSPASTATGGTWRTIGFIVGGLFLLYIGIQFYNYIQKWNGQPGWQLWETKSTGDVAPTTVDGKTRTVIQSGDAPSTGGSDYGFQYWMYISDWNYRFGADKDVLKRIAPNNAAITNPRIFLSPTDNTLNIQMSIYPASTAAGAAAPGSTASTGDSFTCSVENVPLQTWFSVSATVFQRNLDIYINGRLVKSCVLPGVPKVAVGDLILADNFARAAKAKGIKHVVYLGGLLPLEQKNLS